MKTSHVVQASPTPANCRANQLDRGSGNSKRLTGGGNTGYLCRVSEQTRWVTAHGAGHAQWYIERFRRMAAEGVDLNGEARLLDAMLVDQAPPVALRIEEDPNRRLFQRRSRDRRACG